MFRIVLLAAGTSTRFGSNKLLYKYKGKYLVEYVLQTLAKVEALYPVEVVVVSRFLEVSNLCQKYHFKYIVNNDYDKGITSSIHLGLENTENISDCMFLTADMPYLSANTIVTFIKNYLQSDRNLATITCGGECYNPCIFNKLYFAQLLTLKGDSGGKRIIRANYDFVYKYEVSALEVKDIDYIQDLKEEN